ncbi:hypothetical protein [Geobacter sp. AOG2]|uniref:hypothetical protein n=1 Tax=Geobacter sp. AOG2 TaxID=1566347 RepID=UPI001CC7BC9F|nr:hypothetical protein [Geobacter sp. AOG2]GFE59674.1 hypothetical protein AOG2_02620 [Geobacter sp. AOG2]
MPEGPDDLEKLLMDVQKAIRDNEQFLKNLGDDALESDDTEELPDDVEGGDEDSFEEL